MIAIIGAGISGLTLAYELERAGKEYILLEASDEAGGYIKTEKVKDYLLEHGPGSILADLEIKNFLWSIGLNASLIKPEAVSSKRYVYRKDAIVQMPSNPLEFIKSDFFSWNTKFSLIKEMFKKPLPGNEEESIGAFFERRFNKEIVDYAVAPFVSGIYAGDPYQLLISKTFPFLKGFEAQHGSVIKGFMKAGKDKSKKKEALYFKGGMQTLAKGIAKKISHVQYGACVTSISRNEHGLSVEYSKDGKEEFVKADKVVMCLPSFITSELVKKINPVAADAFAKIVYPSIAKVFIAYKKKDIGCSMNGYGVLYPPSEKKTLLGSLWNSSTYPISCPSDEMLITNIAGGTLNPEYAFKSEEEILKDTLALIAKTYKITAPPVFVKVSKIARAIPQYDKNMIHSDIYANELEKENIIINANWRRGASLSDCIKKSVKLADRI